MRNAILIITIIFKIIVLIKIYLITRNYLEEKENFKEQFQRTVEIHKKLVSEQFKESFALTDEQYNLELKREVRKITFDYSVDVGLHLVLACGCYFVIMYLLGF